eukprot:TRINITY_DN5166_c0_g1_i1.p1 TRINITY_DN5166_c0_g1~~TRINITY_DN5166_c0_g1_i1.p1  ORF type:complete len:254 (+),score=63.31 TRINITY_DN5166_c0_g1_i1:66-764(+)
MAPTPIKTPQHEARNSPSSPRRDIRSPTLSAGTDGWRCGLRGGQKRSEGRGDAVLASPRAGSVASAPSARLLRDTYSLSQRRRRQEADDEQSASASVAAASMKSLQGSAQRSLTCVTREVPLPVHLANVSPPRQRIRGATVQADSAKLGRTDCPFGAETLWGRHRRLHTGGHLTPGRDPFSALRGRTGSLPAWEEWRLEGTPCVRSVGAGYTGGARGSASPRRVRVAATTTA